ncbi:hybrid sensor histidine kinase/response regulator transcription factor [Bacteroides sp. UBA939]|uniref:hybrid sensor histidine kinase/response regulator transcription factor n=1 Tax=Bacteroides sp. UBA939 TaxID=1946092 RepID=UPI0025BA3FDC|nr:hybrid sensor histidine kinase/response regulator transcription factor [Bacteroides sp. UBA939]
MKQKTLLLFLAFSLSTISLWAERSKYSFFYSQKLNEGISQLSVMAICQDTRGYLWLGTRNGLNRYNGSEYTVFRHHPGDSLSLADNEINAICEGNDNSLWIGTGRGLSRMCLHTGRIRNYFTSDGLPHANIYSLLVDQSGKVWAGTRNGLCRFLPEQDRFESVNFAGGLNAVSALLEDKAGNFWIGTVLNGVYQCNKQMQVINHYDRLTGLPDNNVSTLYEDSYHRIWVGCQQGGLNRIDARNNKITSYTSANSGLKNNYVRCLAEWGEEMLIGTFDGIYAYSSFTDNISQVSGYEEPGRALGHFSVYSFCIDHTGTLWIGTFAGGVTWLSSLIDRFVHHAPGKALNLQTGIYGTACVDKHKRLWIATEGNGLLQYDISTGEAKFHLIDKTGYSVNNSNVFKTVYAEDDYIWCGTALGEVYRFDIATHRFSLFYKYPVDLVVYDIVRDADGNLWVGTSKSGYTLTCFTPSGERKTEFTGLNGEKLHFSSIRCMVEESPGVLLIGTRPAGLYRYNVRTGEVSVFNSSHSDRKRQIPSNYISSILLAKSGDVWVSTYGGGIFQLDKQDGGVLRRVTESDGLMSGDVCKLLEGADGNLWMSSLQGISCYSPVTEEIKNFPFNNGIFLREFTYRGGVAMPDGTLCFTGNDGFITFYTPEMPTNRFVPPVVLEGLSVNNQAIQPGDETGILDCLLNEKEVVSLQHNQNNLTISYKSLNFINPEMNRYTYKLEGYDKDWNYVANRSAAYYTNLRPGSYLFHVKASNNDDVWNETGKTLKIIIAPPVWRTWYAYLLYVILAIWAVYTVIHYVSARRRLREKLRMEQKDKQRQEEFHRAKMHLFTNFAHELRTPLTLIITPFEELVKRMDIGTDLRDKLTVIYKNAQRLYLLVNQLMDLQKNQSGTMELKVTENNVYEFVAEIYCAFNQVAQNHEITFTLDCKDKEFRGWYDKVLLEKVVFNLLSNAFKYTSSGKDIRMSAERIPADELKEEYRKEVASSATYMMLQVVDAGHGIPLQERDKVFTPFYQVPETSGVNIPGIGIGLSLVHSIVKLHRGTIRIEDREDGREGARIIVLLPVSREAFTEKEMDFMPMDTIGDTAFAQPVEESPFPVTGDIPKKPVILLVEDDKDVRDYLYKALENDYEIIEAANGVKGYEKAVQFFPDLVLSDIMMPKRNGLELTSMIKNDIRIGHIPVILMTARSMVIHIKEGFQAGADDYIIKPFSMDVLRIRIRSLLRSREQLKKLYGKRFSPEVVGVNTTSADERFSQKLYEVIEKNISDQNLGVDMLCTQIGISRANLYRKIKAISELSPTELIRNKRLEVALRYLKDSDITVSEVANLLGFNSHSYFSNSFKALYGFTPSEFVQMNSEKTEKIQE